MFGRKSAAQAAQTATTSDDDARAGGKGRPTPTRKEAEAARKASLKIPSDPKEARRALRERERAQRTSDRAALLAGDESRLPARDAGPVRSLIRDTVDRRRSVGEIFIPVAVGVLIAGLFQNPTVIAITYYAWLVMLGLVLLDIGWLVMRVRRAVTTNLPDERLRAGDYIYAAMRSLTLRKLRLPPPRLRPGGAPVQPKQKKTKGA